MSTCKVCGGPYSEHGGMGAACPLRARDKTVACVVDVASRAAQMSGETVSLSARRETLDGVEHVRLVTDPVSVLMPLSAFRYVVAWVGGTGERLADLSHALWMDAEDEVTKLKSFIADEIAAEHRALDEWRENGGPDWKPDHPAMQRLARLSEALR